MRDLISASKYLISKGQDEKMKVGHWIFPDVSRDSPKTISPNQRIYDAGSLSKCVLLYTVRYHSWICVKK